MLLGCFEGGRIRTYERKCIPQAVGYWSVSALVIGSLNAILIRGRHITPQQGGQFWTHEVVES